MTSIIEAYEREQEQHGASDAGRKRRKQLPPLHYLAFSLDDQAVQLPSYVPSDSRIALAVDKKHWLRIVCVKPLTLACELGRIGLHEHVAEVMRMYPSLRDGHTAHGLPIPLSIANYWPLSEDPATCSFLLLPSSSSRQYPGDGGLETEYEWVLRRALLLDSFGQTSHALRLCSLILDHGVEVDSAQSKERVRSQTEVILSCVWHTICSVLCSTRATSTTRPTSSAGWQHCARGPWCLRLLLSIRQPQEGTKFSDVTTAIMND